MIAYPKPPRRIRHQGRRLGVVFLGAAGLALAAAGCNSSGGGSSAAAPAPAPAAPASAAPTPTPTANGATISARPTSLGTILVDAQGRTVYDFAKDKTSASTCTGACAAAWPPVPAPASLPASLPGVTGALGMTVRSDGTRQLTVAGHPVYTFVSDSAPGQTKGQGVVAFGGAWWVVSPAGAPETKPAGG